VYEYTNRTWYKLGASTGSTWKFKINSSGGRGAIACTQGSDVAVVSRSETVTVPAGTFNDCLHLRFQNCINAGVKEEWYARGVGLVKRRLTQQDPMDVTFGQNVDVVLREATISGRVYGGGTVSVPQIVSLTTERICQTVVGWGALAGTVRISWGFGAGLGAYGGVVGLEINGRAFTVTTRQGDMPTPTLDALMAKIEAAGYRVTETAHQGIDSIELTWKIE
jgi:hypothetical protein